MKGEIPMKKNIFILPLLAISVLSGCTPPSPEISSAIEASSSVKEGPKDEQIVAEEYETGLLRFNLPEFEGTFTTSYIGYSSRLPSLSYGDHVITEGAFLHYYASDVNGDGFRELVFEENVIPTDRKNHYVVYDVKNDKRLFDTNNMTTQKYGYLCSYSFMLRIINDRLTFVPYIGEYKDYNVIDYGHLKWSEEKGCHLEWENPFDIKSIVLEGIYNTNDHTKLHLDGGRKEDGEAIDLYYFEKNTSYQMEITVVRGNKDRYLASGFLSMEWDSQRSYVPTCYNIERSSDPLTGKYVMEFSTSDFIDFDLHDWTFYFGFYGFSFYSKVMQGLAN